MLPVVAPLITARSDAPQQIMVHSSNQRHTGTLGFQRGRVFSFPEFLRHFDEKRMNFAERWFCFRNLPKNNGKLFLNFLNLVRISAPLRTPIAITQKLWQNTSYLQLSGLNNWFYVIITIFAQHSNICGPKLVEWRCLLPHLATRQATVTDVCVALNLLLQLQTRRQPTLAMKRQIWHG